jgi:hypothetical protein
MSGKEFVEEGLPTLKDSRELADYIYKVNRMSGVTDAFKAILNTPILPQYKIECIQWYNSYYGSYGHPAVQKTQEFVDIPPERFRPPGLMLDADVEARRKAEEKEQRDYHQWQHDVFNGKFSTAPAKTSRAQRDVQPWSPPQIDAQTWGEWRKSKLGFGGKTRKSRSRR